MSTFRSYIMVPTVILSIFATASVGGELETANIAADAVHSNGKTALMLAARSGNGNKVAHLIEIGADVNRTNNNGGTPLMYAVLGGNMDIVRLFIAKGVNLDAAANNGWTALMIASAKGSATAVRVLLDQSADPNLTDIYGWTPLMRAVYENHEEAARQLIVDDRTRINHSGENGVTALHIATVRGNVDLAAMLLENGADKSSQDEVGRTPWQIARQNKNRELVELLKLN